MKSENFLDEATKPTLDSACTDKQYKNAGTFLMQLHSQKTVVEPGSHFSFTHLTFWRSFGTSAGERRSVGQMLLLYSIITKVLLIVDTTSWLIVVLNSTAMIPITIYMTQSRMHTAAGRTGIEQNIAPHKAE